MNRLVSVYITTHNRCDLLARAVESVLIQTYSNLEIVISDDGSSDGTQKYVEELMCKNKNIIYVRNEVAKGACHARNQAIKKSKGFFITGLDDDDYFDKKRIETLVREFEFERYSCVCSPIIAFGDEGVIKTVYDRKSIIGLRKLLYFNHIGNQVLTTRDRLLELGGFDEDLKSCQDYDMWVRLVDKYGECKRITNATYYMYIGSGHTRITNSSRKIEGHKQFFTKHKPLMSHSQIKSFKFFTLLATERDVSLLKLFSLVTLPVIHIQAYSLIKRFF